MVQPVRGKHFHLGRTIAVKGAAKLLECTRDGRFLDIGLEFIDHVLERYVNLSDAPAFGGRHDMWEFTGDDGRPYVENGALLNDPGTVMEFIGFSLKLARLARAMGLVGAGNAARIERIESAAPEMLTRCFATGFSAGGLGLVRTVDLLSGRFLNDHLSWWGQMEGLRSAVLAAEVVAPGRRREIEALAARASNAYIGHFIRRDLHLMAYQTLDREGKPVDAIPATPDADVLYHTGLCLFDCLDVLDKRI
jgi:mannose/cellobiose epimerase-like protein (N-acyl-D-glucosamine 2-epimerase family)